MVQQSNGTAWYKLKPDATGSYINGTWTALAPMNDSRLYFASVVLPDGRVFVGGGEYGTGTSSVEIYDPVANAWTRVTSWTGGDIGDSTGKVLPDGRVLLLPRFGGHWIYNPTTDTWTAGSGKGNNDEQSVALMGDGNFMVAWDGSSQKYISALNQWVSAASPPNGLIGAGSEIGPSVLLYDGRVFCLGANGNTDIYTESSNPTDPGTFVAGPNIPNGLMCDDAPAAVMPNGHVLFVADKGNFTGPASIFEYDPSSNNYTNVGGPSGGVAYTYRMLMLPSGDVLVSTGGSISIYTPSGAPNAAWKPTVSSITLNPDTTYKITGTQLNGLTEGAYYGDDAQMSSNYPIIRLVSGSTVYYPRSVNFSTMGVATGNQSVSASFSTTGIPNGNYSLYAVANGIASNPISFSIGTQLPLITSPLSATGALNSPFSYAITASNSPTSFSASGLPAGLSVNTSTGVISGTPNSGGTFNVSISATNASGTGSATLVLTILTAPVINSSLTAGGSVNTPFSYAITATNSPTSFSASGLPAGLSVNTATGVISGTPTVIGTSTVSISATNVVGTGSATLTLTVTNGLVLYWKLDETTGSIASDASGNGNFGTLSGGTWTAGKVNGGLSLNGAGQMVLTSNNLSSQFAGGSVTIALWFKASAAGVIVDELGQPAVNSNWHDSQLEILSDGSVYARVWQLPGVLLGTTTFGTWTHVALRYDRTAQKLDGFLNGVLASGSTSGVKQWPGALYYGLGATDSTNVGSGAYFYGVADDLHIYNRALAAAEVAALAVNSTPVITSATSASVTAGSSFNYTITATNTPTSFNATGLPAGLSVNTASGVISGTPATPGVYTIALSATNASGTGIGSLTLTVNNALPVITSAAAATPNPAQVNQSVAFTVAASDVDGDTLTYSWAFGDGANGSGAAASHAYSAAGTFTATVTVSDGQGGTVTSSVTVTVTNVATTASATFVTTDRTTQGNWKSTYGADGYAIEADSASNPAYGSVAFANNLIYTWNSSTTDVRAPLKAASNSDRIAACWYNNPTYTIDVNLTDGKVHQVALYCLDWDSTTRSQTFTISDAGTGIVLDGPRALTGYNGGAYEVWNIKGHVTITLNCTGGYNAVVSGVFFGAGNSNASDTVWVEDAIPAGGIAQSDGGDGWAWVSANPTPFSGNLASQSNSAAGEHQHYFTNATQTLTINTGDTLIAYVYLDPLNTPSEIMLQWNNGSWEHGAYWGANSVTWGVDGTISRVNMGPLPATGQWVRLQVPASVVGLEGSTLTGMAFTLFGGRATWDHAGKGPVQTVVNDTVWVEDSIPAGGLAQSDGGDTWNWINANPAPYSGSLASQSNIGGGEHQHYFTSATQTLVVNVGDTLIAYVYLDPVNTPSEIMLQWNNGSWEHRAYWGVNSIGWGNDGTVSRHFMGALPAPGKWVRLQVPANIVGLEGSTLNGMAFTLNGGQATWDHAGKGAFVPGLAGPAGAPITPDASPAPQDATPPADANADIPATIVNPLKMMRLQATVSFAKVGRDACSLSGTIPNVPAFKPAGQAVVLNLNGVKVGFTLDAKGRATNAHGSILMKQKAGTVSFAATLKSGSWTSVWNLDPSKNASNVPMSLDVNIDIGSNSYATTVTAMLSAKARVGGKLRK